MPDELDSASDDDDSMPWLPRALAVVFAVGFLCGAALMFLLHGSSVQSLRKENFELRQANWLLEKDRGKGAE